MSTFRGTSLPISQSGLNQVSSLLGVAAAEIWTVLSVETHGFGFLPDRRPAILFERHIFHDQTGGRFSGQNPDISSPETGGYLGGAKEYDRLAKAMALDRHAALNSASWGIGQVMGFNSAIAGFPTVEAMVEAMVQSEDTQLEAMAKFVRSKGLDKPLATHDWTAFARGYNGKTFEKNQYDKRLAAAFQALSIGPLPDIRVRQAQALLTFLGNDVGGIDGVNGKRTRSAVVSFRQAAGQGNSESIDDALIAALLAKLSATSATA